MTIIGRRGISAWGTIMIMVVIGIVIILLFFSFQSKGFRQEQTLFGKLGSKAMSETPCFNAPSISLPVVTRIYPSDRAGNFKAGLTKIMFDAGISSGCGENLTITWKFGELEDNSYTTIETECAYPYDAGNCSIAEYEYDIAEGDLWRTLPVSVSAYGTTSGFYTEDSTDAFITDPEFKFISVTAPDSADFSCVNFDVKLENHDGEITDLASKGIRIEVIDNYKPAVVDYVSGSSVFYRADKIPGEHQVEVRAIAKYQTISFLQPLSYTAPKIFKEKPEIVILGKNSLSVFRSNFVNVDAALKFNGQYLPNPTSTGITFTDLAVGDITGDGSIEVALLGTPGDLFALPFSRLKSDLDLELKDKDLTKFWSLYWLDLANDDGSRNYDWIALASGKNIDDAGGNLLALTNPGRLDAYSYAINGIKQTGSGWQLPDTPGDLTYWWKDAVAYDVNKDGKEEVILVRGIEADKNSDMYIFKYTDFMKEYSRDSDMSIGDMSNIGQAIDIPDKTWKAVAAGHFNGDPNTVEVAILGDGAFSFVLLDSSGKLISSVGIRDLTNWPTDVTWSDAAMADVDGDGADEVILLYERSGFYYIMSFGKGAAITADFGGTIDSDNFKKLPEFRWASVGADKTAFVVGDMACT